MSNLSNVTSCVPPLSFGMQLYHSRINEIMLELTTDDPLTNSRSCQLRIDYLIEDE